MLMEKFADRKMAEYKEAKQEMERQIAYDDQVAEIRMAASPLKALYVKK